MNLLNLDSSHLNNLGVNVQIFIKYINKNLAASVASVLLAPLAFSWDENVNS